MPADERLKERITELELALTHLQNDFESLNEMILKNGVRLDQVSALIQRLTDKFETQNAPLAERNIDEEKPPHY